LGIKMTHAITVADSIFAPLNAIVGSN
jgi:hypothetical protein